MKKTILSILSILTLCLISVSSTVNAGTHLHSPVNYGGEDDLNAWSVITETFVPIQIKHKGEDTRYYIEVNNKRVSNVFIVTDNESLELDVPVELKDQHGAQTFKVCSVAFHGNVGSRICTKAELFLIKPYK